MAQMKMICKWRSYAQARKDSSWRWTWRTSEKARGLVERLGATVDFYKVSPSLR